MMRRLLKGSLQPQGALQKLFNQFGSQKPPIRVTVTGAAGAIGYALVFRIASGDMLGKDQPVILQLIELPQALKALQGVAMELNDCAFPLVKGIVCTDNQAEGFKDSQYALLVGAKPRGPGMERGDLLMGNAKIFIETAKYMSETANRNIKVVVVGNPCNTNALILANHITGGIPKANITSMTRLDHNRALYQLSAKIGVHNTEIEKLAIFGNHSPTMVPYLELATSRGKKVKDLVDQDWMTKTFIPSVQLRGAEIIKARGFSSAASAANAAIDHMRTWTFGTNGGWTAMGVESDGSYGIPKGLNSSFPVIVKDGKYTIVKDAPISAYYKPMLEKTIKELESERKAVEGLLK